MVRVGQAAFRTNGEPAQSEQDDRQENGKDLKVCMVSYCIAWSSGVETGVEDSSGNDEEEDNGSEDAVRLDESMVLREC